MDKWIKCPVHGTVTEDYCRWCGSGQYCENAPVPHWPTENAETMHIEGSVRKDDRPVHCCECGRDITDEAMGWHYRQKDLLGDVCVDCLERLIMTDQDAPL